MGEVRVFIDFGSTFTKVVVFDLAKEELLARVQVPSTVDRDITLGLEEAWRLARAEAGLGEQELRQALACSSAAGGLKVACVGLVPEYTTEAARLAALGAGAKIVGVYSYELSETEAAELEELAPDIVLLSGGTDGGNKKVILHNARLLARTGERVKHIVVAGNKAAHDEVRQILGGAGKHVILTQNVMPEFGRLEVEPCNRTIRELFLSRITEAKGIARVRSLIRGVVMPTPAAVLEAARLLAEGAKDCPGLGELVLVDVGGATTDVYSVAKGLPTNPAVITVGLAEPYVKRTVEGDLGMVHNLETLREIVGAGGEAESPSGVFEGLAAQRGIPRTEREAELQVRLARAAVKAAVDRHVGRLEARVSPQGEFLLQRGKDLTEVGWVVGTGGPVAFSPAPQRVLEGALFRPEEPVLLKPKAPRFLVDRHYIMFALGLLSQSEPSKAARLMRKYLKPI
ncbi:MAG: methylaspartate mutase accessory protein GlmL [Clostridia bacterium]|nr:methylaspartate mutase accessory protein GlmL [Clostridia bacterium]